MFPGINDRCCPLQLVLAACCMRCLHAPWCSSCWHRLRMRKRHGWHMRSRLPSAVQPLLGAPS